MTGAAGTHQLRKRHARQGFGEQLRHASRRRDRSHGACQHRRHDDGALVVPREHAQRAEHAAVEGQRRVRVDVAEQHGLAVDRICAKEDLCHAHGVGGVSWRFRRAFAALVAVAEERILHVEVALALRDVHRLDHAAAGEVDGRRGVRELDEVVQVLQRAVAAAAIEVGDERRAAHRREHRCVAAEADAALGVARVQNEFLRRRAEQRAGQAAGNAHALAAHVGAGVTPQAQRFGVATEFDADFLEDRLGVRLDDLDRFAAQQFDVRDAAADVRQLAEAALAARRAARFPVAAAAGTMNGVLIAQPGLRAGRHGPGKRGALIYNTCYV